MDKPVKEVNRFIQPGKERLVKASALQPVNSGLKLLINVCAQNGQYDQPFDKELAKKWSKVREDYRRAYVSNTNFKLGCLIDTAVSSDIWNISMVVKDKDGNLNQKGLELAVKNLAKMAKAEQASLHFAAEVLEATAGLKELIMSEAVANGTNLYVYVKGE
jgi:hypothetical protein